MAQLAIKGHATRGKEVIELLEMLGGKNSHHVDAIRDYCVYFIDGGKIFTLKVKQIRPNQFTIFTLEELLEKFPYKVGDRVKNTRINDFIGRITNIRWDNNEEQVIYCVEWNDATKSTLTYYAKGLQPYKEETMEDIIKIDIPKGYEFVGIDDDKQQAIFERIKPKYPKTHNECCDVLGLPYMQLGVVGYKCETLHLLQQLLLYRDAYWKLAGDWKPNVEDEKQDKYAISNVGGKMSPEYYGSYNSILCFPTREIRDIFFETFQDVIEECKELL